MLICDRSASKRKQGRGSAVVQPRKEDNSGGHLGLLLRGFPARSSGKKARLQIASSVICAVEASLVLSTSNVQSTSVIMIARV